MRRLATVAALCGVVLFIFGIVGVEVFKGTLHHYCTHLDPSSPQLESTAYFALSATELCDPLAGDDACGAGRRCDTTAGPEADRTVVLVGVCGRVPWRGVARGARGERGEN